MLILLNKFIQKNTKIVQHSSILDQDSLRHDVSGEYESMTQFYGHICNINPPINEYAESYNNLVFLYYLLPRLKNVKDSVYLILKKIVNTSKIKNLFAGVEQGLALLNSIQTTLVKKVSHPPQMFKLFVMPSFRTPVFINNDRTGYKPKKIGKFNNLNVNFRKGEVLNN